MQARYYDPVIGRFYSNDPVDAISHLNTPNGIHGFNRYGYANNNPYKYTDPTGGSSLLTTRISPVAQGVRQGIANPVRPGQTAPKNPITQQLQRMKEAHKSKMEKAKNQSQQPQNSQAPEPSAGQLIADLIESFLGGVCCIDIGSEQSNEEGDTPFTEMTEEQVNEIKEQEEDYVNREPITPPPPPPEFI